MDAAGCGTERVVINDGIDTRDEARSSSYGADRPLLAEEDNTKNTAQRASEREDAGAPEAGLAVMTCGLTLLCLSSATLSAP